MFKMISESSNVSYASDEDIVRLIENDTDLENALNMNVTYLDESGGVYTILDGVAYDVKKIADVVDASIMQAMERINSR